MITRTMKCVPPPISAKVEIGTAEGPFVVAPAGKGQKLVVADNPEQPIERHVEYPVYAVGDEALDGCLEVTAENVDSLNKAIATFVRAYNRQLFSEAYPTLYPPITRTRSASTPKAAFVLE